MVWRARWRVKIGLFRSRRAKGSDNVLALTRIVCTVVHGLFGMILLARLLLLIPRQSSRRRCLPPIAREMLDLISGCCRHLRAEFDELPMRRRLERLALIARRALL